jgi:cytochrome P450
MAMTDVEVAGTVIPDGDTVVLVWGAANHDPAHFPDPERFDITRNAGGHLAFGHGIHFCVGAALGRAEAKAAITALLPHLGGLRLAEEPPPVLENVFAYGHQRIELVPR